MSPIATICLIGFVIYFSIIPSLKYRTVPIKKIILFPLIFLYLAYITMKSDFPATQTNIALALSGIFLGALCGSLIGIKMNVTICKEKKSIGIPGSLFILYTFLFIFAVHFTIGFLKATQPAFFQHFSVLEAAIVTLLGLSSSISLGRCSIFLYRYAAHS